MAVRKRKGRPTGKVKTQRRGLANQVAGAAQDVYGQAAKATRNWAVKLDQWSRSAVETQPYTSALVVFGMGWLLGNTGRVLGGKTRGVGTLFRGKTQGIGGLLGRKSEPWASITLTILADVLVDIGVPGR